MLDAADGWTADPATVADVLAAEDWARARARELAHAIGSESATMMTVLGIVLFFLGILISIAWHELGHFVTARWFGIKVPEFMVGFGRTIWSRKVGETEFGLKAIPLGGYIRMIGMIPPAKGETLGRSRRTGPFQGLIDDARQQSAMDVLPEDARPAVLPARARGSASS